MKQNRPPRLANILLWMILRRDDYLEKTGDLEEVYSSLVEDKGKAIAIAWYWMQTITAIPAIVRNSFYWSMSMFKNYLKISLRKLLQQKIYSFITISGLAVGLGIFLLFFTLYSWRATPDSFHKDIDRIYNVVQVLNSGTGDRHTAYIAYPLAPSLKNDLPEIEDYTRFYEAPQTIVQHKENNFYENGICFADPNFLSMFTFNLIEGNYLTLLSRPNSIVLTESVAKKYFGDKSPIGKTLTLNNKADVVVTGVVKNIMDMPSASSIYFTSLVPLELAKSLYGSIDNWKDNSVSGFIRLKEKTDLKQVESKLEQLRNKYYESGNDSPRRLYLYPTKGLIYKAPNIERFANYQEPGSFIIFIIVGSLFLLIGIFNYINLATARYTERLKELGVRKVIGAGKLQLVKQFMSESILTALLALPLTLAAYNVVYSIFNAITPYMPDISIWNNKQIILTAIIMSILTGVLAGLYPALFLSSLRPIQIIKGKLNKGKSHGRMRKSLVITQFALSTLFIAIALVLQEQADYIRHVDLGYERKGVFAVPLPEEIKSKYEIFKTRLYNNPDIESAAASMGAPGNWQTKTNVIPEGMEISEPIKIYSYGVDYGFLETMSLSIISGRPFSKDYNEENNIIINQKFAVNLGWNMPIGKTIKIGNKTSKIIGVVKDFRFDNLHWPLGPTVFSMINKNPNYLLIKTKNSGKINSVIEQTKSAWKEFSPNIPFSSFTLENYFNDINADASITSKLFGMLGALAILYSGLGLLALASFAVRKRKKEIAIRKTLGASMPIILAMLSKDFMKLVIIADFAAVPIAYLLSKKLIELQSTITMPLGAGVFIFTALFILAVAILFIIAQVYKAAVSNPADSLKCE